MQTSSNNIKKGKINFKGIIFNGTWASLSSVGYGFALSAPVEQLTFFVWIISFKAFIDR